MKTLFQHQIVQTFEHPILASWNINASPFDVPTQHIRTLGTNRTRVTSVVCSFGPQRHLRSEKGIVPLFFNSHVFVFPENFGDGANCIFDLFLRLASMLMIFWKDPRCVFATRYSLCTIIRAEAERLNRREFGELDCLACRRSMCVLLDGHNDSSPLEDLGLVCGLPWSQRDFMRAVCVA